MILLIDNYDSFTYNLYQMLKELEIDTLVRRNDEITIEEIRELDPQGIIISPGPGAPDSAGICLEVVKAFFTNIPILGICLGHQVIGAAFGAVIKKAATVKHGKTSEIIHNGKGIFKSMESSMTVMRYHSLLIDSGSIPDCLEQVAIAEEDGALMAMQHKEYPVIGLQFHPESIATQSGKQLIKHFAQNLKRRDIHEKVLN
ncbi:anthranilate synthase/aminodeoxychorismate synthase-like glutamine amidotransferase [Peribacillus deserti]|uniref:Anthranilate synthase/aminodeoxychorismate synthase-like glutamine amidotransferase n=1 Tax=Peribacillus deserti TaxID=673318 RepID=A0ABS2QM69_9BACI|nr:aminodeoxychorismate/anthranilate synthase component II [Peribacillus deserti]MBM7693854.1 anthranilate synthase/aminodeoxychorismate synthase-like glutamine amidotransferase [Peribacillus deserti]